MSFITLTMRQIIFLTTMTAILGLAHWYLYQRWIKSICPTQLVRRMGALLFIICPIAMIIAIRTARTGTDERVVLWAYLGFGYMGFLFFALLLTACSQALVAVFERYRSRKKNVDVNSGLAAPERRALLARGAAGVSILGSGALSAKGFSEGLKPPTIKMVEVPISNLATALDGFKIVQLSDVHIGPTLRKTFLESVVEQVNGLKPDVVAITGDLVDGSVAQLAEHVRPLSELSSKYGTFFTTGNHEYYSGADDWINYLRSLGITVLRNERVTLDHNGSPLDIIGVDDWRAKQFGGDHGHDLKKATRNRNTNHPSVLLAHQPKSIFEAAEEKIDLVLSGHTHGGQLWPFRFMVMLVQPYLEGLYRHNARTSIFVHRGTGYWGIPMRVGVPSEIALITLKRPLQAQG